MDRMQQKKQQYQEKLQRPEQKDTGNQKLRYPSGNLVKRNVPPLPPPMSDSWRYQCVGEKLAYMWIVLEKQGTGNR